MKETPLFIFKLYVRKCDAERSTKNRGGSDDESDNGEYSYGTFRSYDDAVSYLLQTYAGDGTILATESIFIER